MNFSKPPFTHEEQIALLEERGMVIDCSDSLFHLNHINYYRFSGYALHFEVFEDRVRTHRFKKGTKFSDVINLYEFDNRLRGLMQKYLTPVEISIRTHICYYLVHKYNTSHPYLDATLFSRRFFHDALIENIRIEFQRSKEIFVKAYKEKYSAPPLPPLWMVVEFICFGQCSKLYSGLAQTKDKKEIANALDCSFKDLESWLCGLAVLRNLCAHHSRIWNRNFTINFRLPRQFKDVEINRSRFIVPYLVLRKLLGPLRLMEQFEEEFNQLLLDYPSVPITKMGFNDLIAEQLGVERRNMTPANGSNKQSRDTKGVE